MATKKIIFFPVMFIVMSFSALAAVPSPAKALADLGALFANLFRGGATSEQAYLLTFVLYFIIFMAIFIEGLKYLSFFGGKGEVTTPGKWFAFAAALLATLGIFLGEQFTGRNTKDIVETLTAPFGIWGGVVIAALIAYISYKAVRDAGLFGDSVMKAMALSLSIGLMFAGMLLSPALLGWGFVLLWVIAGVGLITHVLSRSREIDTELKERGKKRTFWAGKEVPLGKTGAVRKERKIFIRALRRAYRFNKKAYGDLNRAYKEALKGPRASAARVKKWLEEAKTFEDKEINWDNLISDAAENLEKLARSRPDLQRNLDVLNKSISVNLTRIKKQTEEAEGSGDVNQISKILAVALKASKDLEREILGLRALMEGFEKELEGK